MIAPRAPVVGSTWRRNGVDTPWAGGGKPRGAVSPYAVTILDGAVPGHVRYQPLPSGPRCQARLSDFLVAFELVQDAAVRR